jgi:flagellar motor switch protein FliM
LQNAEVELTCAFGTARVSLRDIVDMRVGDVIPLAVQPVLQAEVDGVPVFECRKGTRNGRYALRVERFVTTEETDSPTIPGAQNG